MSKLLFQVSTFFIFVSFCFSCNEKQTVFKPTSTIIEGHITSAESPVIILQGEQEVKSPLDQQGKFRIATDLVRAGIYKLSFEYQSINLFVVPGDRINITGDYRTLSSGTKFTGDHANENNYLISFENLKTETQPQDFQSFFTQKEEDFISAVESRTTKLNTHQQEYQKKNGPFDAVFAEMLANEIAYEEAMVKMNYPAYFTYLHPDSTFVLSDTYDSFLQNIETDSEESLMIPSYKNFLMLYLEFKTNNDTSVVNIPSAVKKFDIIGKSFQNQRVKDFLYYQLLTQTMDASVNDASMLMSQYNQVQTNSEYKNEVNNNFNRWSHLLKGRPAPGFSYSSISGKQVTLESFKGKVVYIDVWATWCGPCLKELPYLERLQNEMKTKDFMFLSISIDQDNNAWRNMVSDKKMKGVQLFANNAWSSTVVSDYLISGIPRFIIIGKDGNIINSNAPRPSSLEIRRYLTDALGS